MKFKIIMVIFLAGIFFLATKYPPVAIAAGIVWFLIFMKFKDKK